MAVATWRHMNVTGAYNVSGVTDGIVEVGLPSADIEDIIAFGGYVEAWESTSHDSCTPTASFESHQRGASAFPYLGSALQYDGSTPVEHTLLFAVPPNQKVRAHTYVITAS